MLFFYADVLNRGSKMPKFWAPPFISPYKYNLPKFKRKTPPSTEIVNKKTPDYGFNDGSLSTLYVSFTTIYVSRYLLFVSRCPAFDVLVQATCEHDSASPALQPEQWAEIIAPSVSVIIHTLTSGSFTDPLRMSHFSYHNILSENYLSSHRTEATNPDRTWLYASRLLEILKLVVRVVAYLEN